MARHGRQTFKKRQREMTRDQKREEKAKRLAARKDDPAAASQGAAGQPDAPPPKPEPPKVDKDGKPILRVVPIRRGERGGER
ncbi:MAG TPA: hypothetical protein PK668_12280 [Myxococcota bacterium]|nr:hypothetical protein [Myxococcota bacterium]HRY93754.1 hypothetical protein [Myxococcota bacterium]HSA22232.1 hypothetical protein [Myxococcota bacterium]